MARPPEIEDLSRCNSADIDMYVRTPTDPSPDDPKDEMQPELCKEAGATQEPTDPVGKSQLPH